MTFKAISFVLFLFLLALLVLPAELVAQCPMCKASVEANMQDGGNVGAGLNNGILYLLSMPYLLVGIVWLMWYRNMRKQARAAEDRLENRLYR